jgi:hypothetical protein
MALRPRTSNRPDRSRLISLWIVFTVTMAMLPAFNAMPASAQEAAPVADGTTLTYVGEKRLCPEGYDLAAADPNDLPIDCSQGLDEITFQLIEDNPDYDGGTRTSGSQPSSGFSWTDIPGGTPYQVAETVGPEYGEPWTDCSYYTDPNAAPAQRNVGGAPDGQIAVVPAEPVYRLVRCTWYNVPAADEGTSVRVTKYACPPVYDYATAQLSDLVANCGQLHQGVEFEIVGHTEGEKTTDQNGIVLFEGVPYGDIDLYMAPSTGYVLGRVFCKVHSNNDANTVIEQGDEVSPEEQAAGGHITHLNAPEGNKIDCYFFNVPDEANYGTIIITKYLCGPVAVQVGQEPGYQNYAASCTDPGTNYQFSLQTAGGDPLGDRLSGNDGEVSWTTVPPGPVSISESLLATHGTYGAYCTTDPASDQYEQYAAKDETSFDYTVEPGVTLYCSWFNAFKAAGYPVELVKYLCPPGYDYAAASYEDLIASCVDVVAELPFRVANDGGYDSVKSTNANGVATWSSVPAGQVFFFELPPPEYTPVKVYCSATESGGTPGPFQGYDLDTTSYGIEYMLLADHEVTCHWFNLPAEDYGTVIVKKYICEPFFVRGDVDYNDYIDNCTAPGEGLAFSLLDGEDPVATAVTGPDGQATLRPDATGTYMLVEEPASNYIVAAVFCTRGPQDDPTTPEDEPVNIGLNPGDVVTCLAFDYPYEKSPYEAGTVVIHKFECPPGFESTSRFAISGYVEGCQVPWSGVTFNVEQNGQNVGSGQTDASGTAIITDVPAGSLRVSELPLEGWEQPLVFCASYLAENPSRLAISAEQTVENWGHAYDLQEGYVLECYWFNRPIYQGQPGQPIQIIIHKYLCPEQYYQYFGEDEGYEGVSGICNVAEEGVNFDITGGDGGTSGGPTDLNGYAEYNGVAPGSILIAETQRDGYKTVAVFCSVYYTSAGDFDRYPTTNGQLSYYLAAGYNLECYWFNTKIPNYGEANVGKYLCPPDYAYESASRDDLIANCIETLEGVEYTLSAVAGGYSETQATNENGGLAWYEVPPDAYNLTETPPTGYYPVRIFCTETPLGSLQPYDPNYAGQWEDRTESPDNILDIQLTVTAGNWIWCDWFNAPERQLPQVWIYKYYCPDTVEYAWSYHQFLTECTEPGANVKFAAGPEEQAATQENSTDAQGRTQFVEIDPGVLSIEETFPPGYPAVVVFCQYTTPQAAGNYQRVQVIQRSSISLELDYNYVVSCYWFDLSEGTELPTGTPTAGGGGPTRPDIPSGPTGGAGTAGGGGAGGPGGQAQVAPDTPATLIITKHTCPEGYDLYAEDADVVDDCEQLTEGIDFSLIGLDEEGAEPQEEKTDAGGEATWSDLAAGAYFIQETLPEQTHTAFIWTCRSDEREFQTDYPFTPFSYAGPEGQIGITLIAGETLECDWFDVPKAPGLIIATKYQCPGTTVILSQCEPFGGGVTIVLSPVDAEGEPLKLTTGEDGSATVEASGVYSVSEAPESACLIDSEAFDIEGNLIVEEGQQVEVKVFNCEGGT